MQDTIDSKTNTVTFLIGLKMQIRRAFAYGIGQDLIDIDDDRCIIAALTFLFLFALAGIIYLYIGQRRFIYATDIQCGNIFLEYLVYGLGELIIFDQYGFGMQACAKLEVF